MKLYDLIIKNGTVVTASDFYRADIGVKDGKVAVIAAQLNADDAAEVYDAEGLWVMPGGIDIHTHLATPLNGSYTMDDWYEGTSSAASGGTTCVVDYPKQEAGHSVHDVLEKWHKNADGVAAIDYGFSPVITQYGEDMYKELPKLIEEGYPTMKVFMAYWHRINDYDLIKMIDVISQNGGLLGIHCENDLAIDYLVEKLLADGKVETKYHPVSRPVEAEEDATARAVRLANMVDGNVLIVHMSAKGAVEETRRARANKRNVYTETCPHFLIHDAVKYDQPLEEAAKYVITPPLRDQECRDALWAAINNGDIDIVSSDHCAFPYGDKLSMGQGDFTKIPHGAPGIELRMPLVFSEGVSKGRITPQKFVEITSTNPAKIAGMFPEKGTLAVGSDADIAIFDPNKEVTLTLANMKNPCDFTSYEGFKVKGVAAATLSRGVFVYKDGEITAPRGHGKFVKRKAFKRF